MDWKWMKADIWAGSGWEWLKMSASGLKISGSGWE